MKDVRKTGGYVKRFGVGIILSVLLLLMVSTGWAVPSVTDMQPPDSSTQPISTTVSATFSEAMDPATITNGSFTVSHLSGIKAISVGGDFIVALRGDGTVTAWGNNGNGQSTVPAGLSGIKAISAGDYHSLALKADGTVVGWGWNTAGETTAPAGLSDVKAIAAGTFISVALKNDGTVVAWGYDYAGGTTVPAGLSGVTAIAVGGRHTLALINDGTVVAWGENNLGQSTVPAGLSGVTAIFAGQRTSAALKDDGTVIIWGSNEFGECTIPTNLSNVKAIAQGVGFTVALKNDGTVIAWGYDYQDLIAVPAGLSGVTAIAAGYNHTAALRDDGTVVDWGFNDKIKYTPTVLSGVMSVAAGGTHNAALKNDGKIVLWGQFDQSYVPEDLSGVTAIAAGSYDFVALKSDGTVVAGGIYVDGQIVVPPGLSEVTVVAAGGRHTAALKNDGTVVTWGADNYGQSTVPAGLSGIIDIAAGFNHTVALKDDGTVVAWGNNDCGQITVPTGLSGVVDIAAGFNHTVALKDDGTVIAWGSYGQSTVPAGLSGIIDIAAGFNHTVALKDDGTVVAWGANDYGQTTVPSGLTSIKDIAAGGRQTLALRNDGTLIGWGDNTYGQSTVPSSPYESPVEGTVFYDQVTDTATFTPTAPLTPVTTYLATVNTGARSTWGDHIAADVRWSFTTDKAPASATLDGLNPTYDGTAKAVTASTEPAGLNVVITYDGSPTAPTNAGSYAVVATINDPRYQGSVSGTLVIDKATAQIDFVGLNPTYDGTVKIVTATTIPAGLSVDLTYYVGATNAGSYPVDAIISDVNYQGSAYVTLEIAKAVATVTLVDLNQTYDTTAKIVTATTTPAGLNVDMFYDNSATNAGSYPVDAIITDVNYQGSASGTLVIAKATASITLSDLNQTYTGTPRAVTAITDPAGLAVNFTYNGSATAPKNAGSYAVVGTINDLNYEGSATGTLVIAKADQAISFTCPATANLTDRINLKATADSKLPVTLTVTSGPGVINDSRLTFTGTGSVVVTASQTGNNNYNAAVDVQNTIIVL